MNNRQLSWTQKYNNNHLLLPLGHISNSTSEWLSPQCTPRRVFLRKWSRTSTTRCSWSPGRRKRDGPDPVDHVSARPASIPRQKREGSSISRGRLGSSSGSAETTQARAYLGRSLHRHQSAPQWSIPPLRRRAQERRAARLECGAAPPLLLLNIQTIEM